MIVTQPEHRNCRLNKATVHGGRLHALLFFYGGTK
jgi:hypothetical protein